MASFLRPKRGRKATAITQGIILKKGEIFFEVPPEGVGRGPGKIKMGDGITEYSQLPYFYEPPTEFDPSSSPVTIVAVDSTNKDTVLGNIQSKATLTTILSNMKKLLSLHNSDITSMNTKLTQATTNITNINNTVTAMNNDKSVILPNTASNTVGALWYE